MKIEKGNKIVVRVGGGYLEIEEFIKQYTNPEADRISCKPPNVIKRFHNKLMAQNISSIMSVN